MILRLSQAADQLTTRLRVLLLEREEGTWWPRFLREDSESESSELVATQHAIPLKLEPLTEHDLYAIASKIALRAESAPPTHAAFLGAMRTIDALGRPLFGMIAAQLLIEDAPALSGYMRALRRILRRESGRWRGLIPDHESHARFVLLITLATFAGGLTPRANGFSYLREESSAHLLPDVDLLDPDTYSALIGAPATPQTLPGLQPDILGERFVLDRLSDLATRLNATRMLAMAWSLQRTGFLLRAAQDFSGDPGLEVALDALPLEEPDSRTQWGYLVGNVARLANRSDDPLTLRAFARLRTLTRDHSDEMDLQNALANAEFVLANILQFTEARFVEAAAQYAVALEHASTGSEVAAAATNNRGIVNQVIADDAAAFADWTSVIEMTSASDEARACALNNRVWI